MTSFLSMRFKEVNENVVYDSCKCEYNVKERKNDIKNQFD